MMKVHPAANLFPLLEGATLDELAKDIKENGQQYPIITLDDMVLDGRNRLAACRMAKVDPIFKKAPAGCDPITYVISANLKRRHLSEGQLAPIAKKIANMRQGQRTDIASTDAKSQTEAAESVGISRSSLQRFIAVEKASPALAAKVESGEFTPGQYLREGYTITSRGCPNRCWFCVAWKRQGGQVDEFPIQDGWNVLDDNLLACSEAHIRAVFAMLARQKHRVEFTGGIEAARLKPWHVELFAGLKPRPIIWLAYDEQGDLEPLQCAARMLLDAGWTQASHRLRCYVLAGWEGDTQERAEIRCKKAIAQGVTPMAMVYRGPDGKYPSGWHQWQRRWARPAIIHAKVAP